MNPFRPVGSIAAWKGQWLQGEAGTTTAQLGFLSGYRLGPVQEATLPDACAKPAQNPLSVHMKPALGTRDTAQH